MKYISSLREGERINEIYLCKSKQTAMTKAGKPYDVICVYLTDTYKKTVFLEEAEKELLKQFKSREKEKDLDMPSFLD